VFRKKVTFLTWNLRHGGKKTEINNIISSLIFHDTDVIVLTEYRENENGNLIISTLKKNGWTYAQSSNPPKNENGILIMSKLPIEKRNLNSDELPEALHRWNEVYIPAFDMYVLGIHIPNINEKNDKKNHWEKAISYAKSNLHNRCIIIGDFNSCLNEDCEGTAIKYSDYLQELLKLGWIDSWREFNKGVKDYSWYSNVQNGFRIDYAFISPLLKENLLVSYHSHRERIKNYSDHSILVVELIMQ
jgi:exonuclease III